ncbi:hypothetical protein GE061_008811 [Apolygus lucorum]|uniref:Uncharacterized protein n=1 Tax=Apolygus lucorum TaxID=248454 RepID=A0A8S9WNV8_APOLU|nr:hypothetical protein GE061_008811 [Apolygus lucorum]
MSGGKDLYAMFTDVERRLNQGVDGDDSPCDEPVEEPALPRPRVSAIEPSEVVRETIDVDREWGVLESGVEMMCNATNAEDRKHGWHRYASALKWLKGYTRSRHTVASPTLDVNHLADAVARKLRQPPVVGPTPREIAREVVEMLQEKVTLTNPKLAEEIAELVCQRQSPAYSPVHDAGAIADAILNKLKGQANLSLCLPEPTTTIPPAPESLHPDEMTEDVPQDDNDLPQESDNPAEERRCLACKQPRTRHSRLWCEACRVFLRRSHKATAEGRPFACHNIRHQQKPDFENCRGCRARRLHDLETQACHPEDSDDADGDIGFRRGGECNPRVPPLRITVNPPTSHPPTFKRARARSAGSPPEPGFQQPTPTAPPVPSTSFRQPAPEAPPARPPLSTHAPRRQATPSKPKDPHAQP